MKNGKKLLSILAAICTLSIFTACGTTGDGSTGGSTGGSTDIVDTGSTDTGSTDTGSTDTGSTDTGSTDSGSSDTGSGDITDDSGSTDDPTQEYPVCYTVKFVDEDDSVISETVYEAGSIVDVPADPTKAADETYTYAFAGWDSEVTTVTGNITYKATYTATYIEYTVKFVNADDSAISEATYHYGDTVTLPEAPTKAANETYTYTFAGWDSDVVAVAGNVTYKATYTETFIEYSVKFVGDDGVVISEKADYHYGDEVSVPSDPEKAATDYFTYAFAGWDSEVSSKVVGNAVYTAQFDGTLKSGINASKVTAGANESVVLGKGEIGDNASYDKGDSTQGFVNQAYIAFDGEYSFNDFVAFDFTGKNMPEVAFFAKNYDDSMYYADGKQGVVFANGITDYTGAIKEDILGGGKNVNIDSPLMIKGVNDSWFKMGSAENKAIARANLADGTHYRVVLGFTAGSDHGANGIKINWALYNLDTKAVVEESFIQTYNFFTGSTASVNNMKLSDLVGSIVLYGKFGTECTIDKLYGVFEDTTVADVMNGLNGENTYTVTFQTEEGKELKKVTGVKFGEVVSYNGEIPTPEKTEDALFTYAYAWDKSFAKTTADTVYTLKVKATPKKGISTNNVSVNGESIVLGSGSIGDGANYTKGQNNGGFVKQSYLGLDGNYALDSYIVFDFTGKNMPEIAFFAKSYNDSMYAEGTSKQGIVVVTGITEWNGKATAQVTSDKAAGTVLNYGFPYMIDDAANGGFCQGAFKESKLGRENLVDGTHYRVVMGFTKYNDNALNLKWVLYNIDTKSIVEEGEMHTWNFFTGSNAQVGNMRLSDLAGSIVLYGKFGTECTIDKLYGVEQGGYDDVVAKYTKA